MTERKCNRAGCEREPDSAVAERLAREGHLGQGTIEHRAAVTAALVGEWVTHNSLDYHATCAVMVLEERAKELQAALDLNGAGYLEAIARKNRDLADEQNARADKAEAERAVLAEELRNIARSCGKEDTSSVLSLVRVTIGKLSKERDALAARLEEADRLLAEAVKLLERSLLRDLIPVEDGGSPFPIMAAVAERHGQVEAFLARLEALEKGSTNT